MWSLAPVATKLEDCACVARPPWDSELRAPTGRSPAAGVVQAGEGWGEGQEWIKLFSELATTHPSPQYDSGQLDPGSFLNMSRLKKYPQPKS